MRPDEFFSSMEEGPLFPLYYFYGEERYLQDKAVQIVKKRREKELNQTLTIKVYSGGSTSIATIINDARTLPLLEKRKIILLKEADKISTSEQDSLLPYLQSPHQKTILILTGKETKFKGKILTAFKKKIFPAVKKNGMVMQFRNLYKNEVPGWITWMAKELGKSIGNREAYLLQELIGNQLQEVSNEMTKLAIFIGEKKEITREDIEELISNLRVDSIFELTDRIGNRERLKALISLSKLMESGEPPLKILTMIVRQFRMIMGARSLLDQGTKPEQVRKHLNIMPFIWKNLYPQTRKFSQKKLEKCFQQLWKTDLSLKTQRIPPKIVLEQLIMDLCE
ncbi:MAG: DNA polymerase III subunit delta [Proteobacteria bacterium]|nr:DNA polymerase III subunit delta [Pseudomonadota bacterium]